MKKLSNNYAVEVNEAGEFGIVWRVDNLLLFGDNLIEVDGKFYWQNILIAKRLDDTFALDYYDFDDESICTHTLYGPGIVHHYFDEGNRNGDYSDLPLYNTCKYGGHGFMASKEPADVVIDFIRIRGSDGIYPECDDSSDVTYFEAWFDPKTWTSTNGKWVGMIYGDDSFLISLKDNLRRLFSDDVVNEIYYTEQGGQGFGYVHLICYHPDFCEQFFSAQEFLRGMLIKDGDPVNF